MIRKPSSSSSSDFEPRTSTPPPPPALPSITSTSIARVSVLKCWLAAGQQMLTLFASLWKVCNCKKPSPGTSRKNADDDDGGDGDNEDEDGLPPLVQFYLAKLVLVLQSWSSLLLFTRRYQVQTFFNGHMNVWQCASAIQLTNFNGPTVCLRPIRKKEL